jgi:hypothetical protein
MSPPFSSDHGIRNEPADKVRVFKGVLPAKEHPSKKNKAAANNFCLLQPENIVKLRTFPPGF